MKKIVKNIKPILVLILIIISLSFILYKTLINSSSPLPKEEKQKEVNKRIESYLRKLMEVPEEIVIRFGSWEKSEISGLNKVQVGFYRGEEKIREDYLYIANEGRYIILGEVFDITVDPYYEALQKITTQNNPIAGNKRSNFIIALFTDFQCPYCARASEVVREKILPEFGERIKFVFKNFPLKSIHPLAESEAIAAACVYLQDNDTFWKIEEYLFENQNQINPNNLEEKLFAWVLENKNLNFEKFKRCYAEKESLYIINQDIKEAEEVKVTSTPTFFIQGRKVVGARKFEELKKIINQQLEMEGGK